MSAMFRIGLAVGRTLIRTGLRIARAPRRRALAAWATGEGLALEGKIRARDAEIDVWLDEESNAAIIEKKTKIVLPSLAIRSAHAVVRSPEMSLELAVVDRALSSDERKSADGMFEARCERVAEERLEEVFAALARASSPPTTVFVRDGAVVMEVYPPTSAAAWKEHVALVDEIIARLSPRARGPYG